MPTSQSSTAMGRIRAALLCQPVSPVPRGELWLGRELFDRAGLSDTADNHLRLAHRLGQEIVCLPVATDMSGVPDLGYRYFDAGELARTVRHADRFVAAVVDGPFQALVNQKGLMDVLMGWVGQRQALVDAYRQRQAQTLALIDTCLSHGVHGVVIADDLSADSGPMIRPDDIQQLCGAFYTAAIRRIHSAGAAALVHCCGNINALTDLYRTWGVDGFAGVQQHANDLPALRRRWGGNLVLMAGIDAQLLQTDAPPEDALAVFEQLAATLAAEGGLIVCSACGLYQGDFLPRIKNLYARLDARTGS